MYNIAVIPGDGTGPEVVREGLKVFRAVSEKHLRDIICSGAALEHQIVTPARHNL